MVNTMFKLPVFAGLGLVATGMAAKTVLATEKLAVKEVTPLMRQALVKDTLTLLPQAEKTLENAGSVLLAEWSYEKQIATPSFLKPVAIYGCLFPKLVTDPDTGKTSTQLVFQRGQSSLPNSFFSDKQKTKLTKECVQKHKGQPSFTGGISY
jgi:hypothetical protein